MNSVWLLLLQLPVKQLYKVYLQKKIEKADLEMEQMRLQLAKTKKEIQLLDHQLEVGDAPVAGSSYLKHKVTAARLFQEIKKTSR